MGNCECPRMNQRKPTRRDVLAGALGAAAAALGAGCASGRPGPDVEERGWQIGLYTRPWAEHDYRVALDAIAEAGYRHAGLMSTRSPARWVLSTSTSPEEAAAVGIELKKRRLLVPSVYGGEPRAAQGVPTALDDLRRLIDACAIVGARNLLLVGVRDSAIYASYYRAVAEGCDYAASKGIGLSVKPHAGLNADGPQCRRAAQTVNRPNFGVWYDPGNILHDSDGRLDPVQDAAAVDGLVVGMSVKDYRHPKDVMVTPGAGQVDFPGLMARLKRGGFTRGPLVVECLSPGDLPHLLAEARKARRFVEERLAAS